MGFPVEDKKATALRLLAGLAGEAKRMKGANLKKKLLPKAAALDGGPPMGSAPQAEDEDYDAYHADKPGVDAEVEINPDPAGDGPDTSQDVEPDADDTGLDDTDKSDLSSLDDDKLKLLLASLAK